MSKTKTFIKIILLTSILYISYIRSSFAWNPNYRVWVVDENGLPLNGITISVQNEKGHHRYETTHTMSGIDWNGNAYTFSGVAYFQGFDQYWRNQDDFESRVHLPYLPYSEYAWTKWQGKNPGQADCDNYCGLTWDGLALRCSNALHYIEHLNGQNDYDCTPGVDCPDALICAPGTDIGCPTTAVCNPGPKQGDALYNYSSTLWGCKSTLTFVPIVPEGLHGKFSPHQDVLHPPSNTTMLYEIGPFVFHEYYCGDGVLTPEIGEECDDGINNTDTCPPGQNCCSTNCKIITNQCGNGTIDTGEECDNGVNNTDTCDITDTCCSTSCTVLQCGDGNIDTETGEECDDGANNTDNCPIGQTCCSTTCQVITGSGFKGNIYKGEATDNGNKCIGTGDLQNINGSIEIQRLTENNSITLNNQNSYEIETNSECDNQTESCYTVRLHINNTGAGPSLVCSCGAKPGDPYTCEYTNLSSPDENVNFYLKYANLSTDGWFQVYGGNILATNTNQLETAVTDDFPDSSLCNATTNCTPVYIKNYDEKTDTIGFIFTRGANIAYSTNIHDPDANNTSENANTKNIKLSNEFSYQYYDSVLSDKIDINQNTNGIVSMPTFSGSLGDTYVVKYTGNIVIDTSDPWILDNGKKLVVLVDGNLEISDSNPNDNKYVPIETDNKSFISFIVNGDITIDADVGYDDPDTDPSTVTPNIHALLLAQQSLNIQGYSDLGDDNTPDKKLILKGNFIGLNNLAMHRDYDDNFLGKENNNTNPVIVFIDDPNFIINFPLDIRTNIITRVEN